MRNIMYGPIPDPPSNPLSISLWKISISPWLVWQQLFGCYPVTWDVRRGPRIQKGGGGFVHSEGGGGSYRNFRSGSKLLQGPGQTNKQKQIADSRRGGVRTPKKNPVSAHGRTQKSPRGPCPPPAILMITIFLKP